MTEIMVLEELGPDEWERARAVRLRALRDAPDAFGTTYEQALARPAASWRERMAEGRSVTFAARRGGLDVGLVVGAPYEGRGGAAGLFAMWVAPEARGTGVGDGLVEAVIAWARRAGYARLVLDVADGNHAAIALYERHGFEATGVTGTLPPPRDAIQEHERALVLDSIRRVGQTNRTDD